MDVVHIIVNVLRLVNIEETKYWKTCDLDKCYGGKSLIIIDQMVLVGFVRIFLFITTILSALASVTTTIYDRPSEP